MPAKITKINAFMNHARWVVVCPRCHTAQMAEGDELICGVCFPQVRAKALQPIEGGLFRTVPDAVLIAGARKQAHEQGEAYAIVYPADKSVIESIVRQRARVQDINWHPGETVDDLKEQNRSHGDPLPKGLK